jgi:hypothetical protein
MFAISGWRIRPCEYKPRFRVFRFDHKVRVETLTSSVGRCPLLCLRPPYLKRLKLGNYFGVSGLQGNGQDREERICAMCGHGF